MKGFKTKTIRDTGGIQRNKSRIGKCLQRQLEEYKTQKTKIEMDTTIPQVWQAKSEGVLPIYDFRFDKWETALEAINYFDRSRITQGQGMGETEDGSENPTTDGAGQ